MFYRIALLLLFGPAAGSVRGQATTNSEQPLSDRQVSYRMDVTLDATQRTVSGTQRLTWRNPGNVPVDELQFHLYLNGFSPGSTFQVESGGAHRGFSDARDDRWGGVEITRMQVAGELPADLLGRLPYSGGPTDLTGSMRFIQPDDNNLRDRTVMAVSLPEPVAPGATIALDMDFESSLPRITARTGFTEDSDGNPFFMVAQWFPKIAVYEVPGQRYVPADASEGTWNAHQFHANSEFYADFGTYDVTMRVPESYVVGASGVRASEEVVDGTRTIRYIADDVHDFAWTAYEGYQVYEETWRHVNIRLLLRPEHDSEGQMRRHFDAATAALDRFDAWVGEYPYTSLTLVDGIGGANGMEYPTLITCGTVYMIPEWARLLELVTVHEFGHQYFYGLLASNEFEEAWLDEGMNSYVESKIMDDVYGPGSALDLPGLPLSDRNMQRLSYTKQNPSSGALFTRSWEYEFGSDYGKNSYAKPATVMNTLEAHLGWETMRTFLRTYYSRWRFKHPSTHDLQETLEDVAGQDMDWFFDQYVYGTAVLDYRIANISSSRDLSVPDSLDANYLHTVRVERVYDGYMPTTLRMEFEDGTHHDVSWSGEDRWREFSHSGASRLKEAYLDPEGGLWLETRRLNNRRSLATQTPGSRERRKFATRFQQLALLISAIF
jgi:Peptidase family M1 domain